MKAYVIIISVLYASSLAHRTSKQRYEAMNILERENFDPGSQGLVTTPPTTSTTAPTSALTQSTTHTQTHTDTDTNYTGIRVGFLALTLIIIAIAIYLLKLAKKRCERNETAAAFFTGAITFLECAQRAELNS